MMGGHAQLPTHIQQHMVPMMAMPAPYPYNMYHAQPTPGYPTDLNTVPDVQPNMYMMDPVQQQMMMIYQQQHQQMMFQHQMQQQQFYAQQQQQFLQQQHELRQAPQPELGVQMIVGTQPHQPHVAVKEETLVEVRNVHSVSPGSDSQSDGADNQFDNTPTNPTGNAHQDRLMNMLGVAANRKASPAPVILKKGGRGARGVAEVDSQVATQKDSTVLLKNLLSVGGPAASVTDSQTKEDSLNDLKSLLSVPQPAGAVNSESKVHQKKKSSANTTAPSTHIPSGKKSYKDIVNLPKELGASGHSAAAKVNSNNGPRSNNGVGAKVTSNSGPSKGHITTVSSQPAVGTAAVGSTNLSGHTAVPTETNKFAASKSFSSPDPNIIPMPNFEESMSQFAFFSARSDDSQSTMESTPVHSVRAQAPLRAAPKQQRQPDQQSIKPSQQRSKPAKASAEENGKSNPKAEKESTSAPLAGSKPKITKTSNVLVAVPKENPSGAKENAVESSTKKPSGTKERGSKPQTKKAAAGASSVIKAEPKTAAHTDDASTTTKPNSGSLEALKKILNI
jgi:hypothetical protein